MPNDTKHGASGTNSRALMDSWTVQIFRESSWQLWCSAETRGNKKGTCGTFHLYCPPKNILFEANKGQIHRCWSCPSFFYIFRNLQNDIPWHTNWIKLHYTNCFHLFLLANWFNDPWQPSLKKYHGSTGNSIAVCAPHAAEAWNREYRDIPSNHANGLVQQKMGRKNCLFTLKYRDFLQIFPRINSGSHGIHIALDSSFLLPLKWAPQIWQGYGRVWMCWYTALVYKNCIPQVGWGVPHPKVGSARLKIQGMTQEVILITLYI